MWKGLRALEPFRLKRLALVPAGAWPCQGSSCSLSASFFRMSHVFQEFNFLLHWTQACPDFHDIAKGVHGLKVKHCSRAILGMRPAPTALEHQSARSVAFRRPAADRRTLFCIPHGLQGPFHHQRQKNDIASLVLQALCGQNPRLLHVTFEMTGKNIRCLTGLLK